MWNIKTVKNLRIFTPIFTPIVVLFKISSRLATPNNAHQLFNINSVLIMGQLLSKQLFFYLFQINCWNQSKFH